MSILKLTLTKQWFDLIASGKKKFEYREYKQHWKSRLLCAGGTRNYEEIRFTNGYGAHRPFMRVKFVGMAIIDGFYCSPENNEKLNDDAMYFVIQLGEVLEVGNL
jgi:hypothetical protein